MLLNKVLEILFDKELNKYKFVTKGHHGKLYKHFNH